MGQFQIRAKICVSKRRTKILIKLKDRAILCVKSGEFMVFPTYRAQSVLAISKGERVPASLLVNIDNIADTVDKQKVDDLYVRALVRGQQKDWHTGSYLSSRAITFNAAALSGQALKEFNALKDLTEKTFGRDGTRQFAWLDILQANIYMGMKEFGVATKYARQALLACQDIRSITNIAIITDIYGRLLKSRYKSSSDVEELGDMLRESPVNFLEPEE